MTLFVDHRGETCTSEYLAYRNLIQEIRDSGEISKGPTAFGDKDAQNFENTFNSFVLYTR